RERRPRPRREPENVVIEGDRLFSVRRKDGEMIHPSDRHGPALLGAQCASCISAGQTRRLPWRCQAPTGSGRNLTAAARAAHASLMNDRTNKGDSELGILARRRIEAAIIGPIYEEMREAIGEEKARDILRRAIRRAAIDAGTEMASRADGEADLESLKAILPADRDGAFCEGYDPRIKLTRPQTIMGGASHCDFRYRSSPARRTSP